MADPNDTIGGGNRPTVPSFGFQLSALPSRPAAPTSSSDLRRKAKPVRAHVLSSPFSGNQTHGANDTFTAPFDRLTIHQGEEEELGVSAEATEPYFYHAIIETRNDEQTQYHGAFSESSVKFVLESSATAPSAGVRVHDLITGANWLVDLELQAFESVSASVFRVGDYRQSDEELGIAMNMVQQDMKSGWDTFFCLALKRSACAENDTPSDYACYHDSPVDWNPSEGQAACHEEFTPWYPKEYGLSTHLQATLQWVESAEHIKIWVALTNPKYATAFEAYAHIINTVAHSGSEQRFMTDWYWSKHELYVPQSQWKAETGMNDRFFGAFVKENAPPQYPERQPWLQEDKAPHTTYRPVWQKTRNRFAGPHAYRCAFVPAVLWEMEASAVKYNTQFTPEMTYKAKFDPIGSGTLVKVRLSGVGIDNNHGEPQVVPAAGTTVRLFIKGDEAQDDAAFVGQVAERGLRTYDFVMNCVRPKKYMTRDATPTDIQDVTMSANYDSYQDTLAVQSIVAAAAQAEYERKNEAPLDDNRRAPFRISNFIGRRHVKQLSRDYYKDWKDAHRDDADYRRINDIVTVQLTKGLNNEQLQAYLFALRGARAGMLGIEGCPGTGKSHTLRAICIAFILMGYKVFISAQSNNGVDAVFTKVVEYARQHEPELIENGALLRMGASTVDAALMDMLEKYWDHSSNDGDTSFETFTSAITSENIPHSSAYKMSKWMRENPDTDIAKSCQLWAQAKQDQQARFESGPLRSQNKAPMGKGAATWNCLKASMGNPCLVAATAAACRREVLGELASKGHINFDVLIFDEASQATEAAFMTAALAECMKTIGLVILGGDHLQLPPVIKSKAQNPFDKLLEMSPLERLYRAYKDRPVVRLVRNYRSHPDIVKLASVITYEGKMVSGVGKLWKSSELQTKMLAALKTEEMSWGIFAQSQKGGDDRVWLVDTPGFSENAPGSNSSWNPNGAHYTARLASMIARVVGQQNVQVITMYAYEVGQIRRILDGYLRRDIQVQTVDSFQGKEDQIMVIHCSAAWKDRRNPIGFLTDIRRLNVAITRAQNFMFVIGNFSLWQDRIRTDTNERRSDKKSKIRSDMGKGDAVPRMLEIAQSRGMMVKYPLPSNKAAHQDLPRKLTSEKYYV